MRDMPPLACHESCGTAALAECQLINVALSYHRSGENRIASPASLASLNQCTCSTAGEEWSESVYFGCPEQLPDPDAIRL